MYLRLKRLLSEKQMRQGDRRGNVKVFLNVQLSFEWCALGLRSETLHLIIFILTAEAEKSQVRTDWVDLSHRLRITTWLPEDMLNI